MPQENQAQKENKKKEGVKEPGAEYSIRTMRADLARLRLSEGKQERKKIIALQEDQRPTEKTKEPEVFQPEQTAPAIESILAQKGLERKSATLLKGQAELKQNINALNKKENQVNQGIAKINKQKKLVQNEDQIKELDRHRQELLDRKQEMQVNRARYQKQLEETEKYLQETSINQEVKTKTPTFQKELSGIERVAQAKERLGQLTRQQERKEGEQDSAFRESLETRWENLPGKKIPPDIEAMPIKPVKEYPHKPTKETQKSRRIVIITVSALFIVLTGAFLFWFFTKGPSLPPSPLPEPPVSPEQPKQPGGEIEEIEPTPSITLLSIDRTEVIEIQDNIQMADEIKKALTQVSAQTQDTLVRLLFKNTSQGSFVNLPNFFQTFEIKTPEGLLEKFENYATFFIYSYDEIERFGFVAKIKQGEDIEGQMRKWEETIEPDMNSLLAALGNQDSAGTNIFRTSKWQEVDFRFLTISQDDFGICYALYNDLLIFTTSFDQMKDAISRVAGQQEKMSAAKRKIGQLFMVGFEGKTMTQALERFFREYKPGAIALLAKNIGSEAQLKKLLIDLQALSRKETDQPLLIAVDQEGSPISRISFLSEKTPQSQIETVEQAYEIGLNKGRQLNELGVNMNLAPVLDLTTETDFLHNRTFQSNATQTGLLAKSLISGQRESGIISTAKHFPGYGEIDFNPENKLAIKDVIPEISQFGVAKEALPEFVMLANVIYREIDPTLPFTFTRKGIDLVKKTMGDAVLILTDDLDQYSLLNNYEIEEIVTRPLNAGVDMMIFSGWREDSAVGLDAFYSAYQKGLVSDAIIDQAYQRIINLKNKL